MLDGDAQAEMRKLLIMNYLDKRRILLGQSMGQGLVRS
jgi:hypothetical protein